MVRSLACVAVFLSLCGALEAARGQIIDFEELPSPGHPLPAEGYYNGADNAGQFSSHGATFNNSFTDYGGGFTSWEGWGYSNQTVTPATADPDTPDYEYQYSAASGGGAGGSKQYAVAYTTTFTLPAATITLPAGAHPVSMQVNNVTYAAISMLYGDDFTNPFSQPNGDHLGDWFTLTITGYGPNGQTVGSIDIDLADYRAPAPAAPKVVTDWQNVNLSSLYAAQTLSFSLTSSDVGTFGMNTPAYFAADNLSMTNILGDVTADDVVNALDIASVAQRWLKAGPVGDATGDGIVNAADIAVVGSHWLQTYGAVVPIPEPSSALLALLGVAGLVAAIKLRR